MVQAEIHDPSIGELRQFGFVMAAAIGGIFGLLLPWLFDRTFPLWPWPIASLFLVLGTFIPQSLRLVFKWWMRFGLLIGKVTTPLILGILFYVVITPMGFIRRALHKDSLARDIELDENTYRVESSEPDHNHMERPF